MDDLGFLELNNSYDMFKKLQYNYEILINKQNTYTFMDFCITAFHLSEWIKNDDSFTQDQKESFVKILTENNLNLFEDISMQITERLKQYHLLEKLTLKLRRRICL